MAKLNWVTKRGWLLEHITKLWVL